jgi:molybdate transport system substrate-binding protein
MSRDPISIFAAGSLRVVMPALTGAAARRIGVSATVRHGPAGLLRERIERGDRPDLFMSADTGHPRSLAAQGIAYEPRVFARNAIVALARREAGLTMDTLLDGLLDPAIAIGTSTPLKDPSGDYAWTIFRRAEALRPGAFAILDAKARRLVGGAEPTPGAPGYGAVEAALRAGTVDLFLGYVTGLRLLAATDASLEIIPIPSAIAVTPEYAMATLYGGGAEAVAFENFVLGPEGQALIVAAGFTPAS